MSWHSSTLANNMIEKPTLNTNVPALANPKPRRENKLSSNSGYGCAAHRRRNSAAASTASTSRLIVDGDPQPQDGACTSAPVSEPTAAVTSAAPIRSG